MKLKKTKNGGITIILEENETIKLFRETYFMNYETLMKQIGENIRYVYQDMTNKAIKQRNSEDENE